MTCPICMRNQATVGVLCESCRDDIAGPTPISPEQVVVYSTDASVAALIDRWGRPNRIGPFATIGRDISGPGIEIVDGSVSRVHATIELVAGRWMLRDCGSTNGTMLNGTPVTAPVPLADRDEVRFGPFPFFFVEDATHFPTTRSGRTTRDTMRAIARATTARTIEELLPIERRSASAVQLHQPTGGGGGMVEIGDKRAQLTLQQFELLSLLVARMTEDEATPVETRGFIDTQTLLRRLSFDTAEPAEDQLRQLVRRLRRALAKAGIGDLIESRQGFGYRLAV